MNIYLTIIMLICLAVSLKNVFNQNTKPSPASSQNRNSQFDNSNEGSSLKTSGNKISNAFSSYKSPSSDSSSFLSKEDGSIQSFVSKAVSNCKISKVKHKPPTSSGSSHEHVYFRRSYSGPSDSRYSYTYTNGTSEYYYYEGEYENEEEENIYEDSDLTSTNNDTENQQIVVQYSGEFSDEINMPKEETDTNENKNSNNEEEYFSYIISKEDSDENQE